MKHTSRVFIVNSAGHNIKDSNQYGIPVYLTENKVNIFCTDRLREQFTRILKDFNHKEDYILLCGSIILNILAILEALNHGPSVNVLIYNFKIAKYIVRTI